MADLSKPEINLEICTGFFRISTTDVVYNITVLEGPENAATKVVRGIVDVEQGARPAPGAMEDFGAPAMPAGLDDAEYYKQVSADLYQDIGRLAKSLNSTIMDLPAEDRKMKRAELDEAGEKIEDAKNQLRDIVSMTEKATMEIMDHVEKVQGQTDDVKNLLSLLKDHAAFSSEQAKAGEEAGEGGGSPAAAKVEKLKDQLGKAGEILAALGESGAQAREEAPAPEAPEVAAKTRYLFPLDTVFQTIYELCTNEAVKGHISSAREQAAKIFNYDAFVDAISEKVSELAPDDDNFYTVPLSDVLNALRTSCSEKKIQNLFAKMETNQADIFLDQALPLEAPPTEEAAASEPAEAPEPLEPEAVADPRLDEASAIIQGSMALVEELGAEIGSMAPAPPNGLSCMTLRDQEEIFGKIENAFAVAASISDDVTRITEVLSFQDLSGQQILKIIKLLSDFQVQLLSIVVSFGSQLKSKEQNATITPEESKRLAQEDVDHYLKSVAGEGEEGPLDQETVNKMLEELGF